MADRKTRPIIVDLFAFLLVSLLFTVLPVLPALTDPETGAAEDTIRLLARHQEKNGPVWLAQGEVELRFGPLILLADWLQVNRETYEVVAEGQVTLQLPSEVVACDRLLYNLQTGEGKLEGVRAISRPGIFLVRIQSRKKRPDSTGWTGPGSPPALRQFPAGVSPFLKPVWSRKNISA